MNSVLKLKPGSRERDQMDRLPSVELASLPISRLGLASTMTLIAGWLADRSTCRRIATANLDFLRLARDDRELEKTIRTADLCTADGWPVVTLSRIAGKAVEERVAGSDLTESLLEHCAEKGRRVYFLGGAPGTAAAAARVAQGRYPELEVAGAQGPMIDLGDSAGIKALCCEIRDSRPDLLLVGLGCPKQEFFLRDYLVNCGASVGIGVGGSFDFMSGRRERAPEVWIKLRAEWLWRLSLEPRRLFRRYLSCAAALPRLVTEALWQRVSQSSGR